MAGYRDAVAGLQDILVPLHGTLVARESVRARELAAPLNLFAVASLDRHVDEHVWIDELKVGDGARHRDFLLGLEQTGAVMRERRRGRQHRRRRYESEYSA